jgi:CheY-like chemotaxis protein
MRTGVSPSTNIRPVSPSPALTGFQALLVDRGLISRDDLAVAGPHAASAHLELADALVALGLVSEADSYAALATAAGVDFLSLEGVVSSALAVQLVPEKLARRHLVIPLQVDNRTLTYASCRASSAEAETDLGFASGRRVKAVIATRTAVMKALDLCYPKPGELDVLAKRLLRSSGAAGAKPASETVTSSVVEMCNDIIRCAVGLGAGDVVIERHPQSVTIRFRVGGVFQTLPTLPGAVSEPIADRFKIMARVGVAVRNRPQQGTFQVPVEGHPIVVRLSTRPFVDGDEIIMQLVDSRSPAPAPPPSAPLRAPGRIRVLVADDEVVARLMTKLMLEREGFDVIEAINGEQAIEIAVRERPDLMLIDLNMPVMDGYQSIHLLRGPFKMAALPIIVITAEDGQSVERRVLELGANDYIVKPYEPAVLLARVNAIFSRINMKAT